MGALNADPGLERWNFMSQGVPGVTLFSLPSPVGGELFQAEDDIGRVPICALLLVFAQGFPFLEAQVVKNWPAMWETWVQSLGQEDPLEEGMATHSSILAWRIPMDRGAWWATGHGVPKNQVGLSDLPTFLPSFLEEEGELALSGPQAHVQYFRKGVLTWSELRGGLRHLRLCKFYDILPTDGWGGTIAPLFV